MGREIRKVIPNWEHPKREKYNIFNGACVGEYIPMFDEPYINAINEWIEGHQLWEKGEHPDRIKYGDEDCRYYAQWNGEAPQVHHYRPDWKEEDATWYQVYETVSEGTPVTPPFATREELVEYLVENGDFWDQSRRKEGPRGGFQMPCDPWSRKSAENFVFKTGYAPSMIMTNDGTIKTGVEALGDK